MRLLEGVIEGIMKILKLLRVCVSMGDGKCEDSPKYL
jgi:hypothetical protein